MTNIQLDVAEKHWNCSESRAWGKGSTAEVESSRGRVYPAKVDFKVDFLKKKSSKSRVHSFSFLRVSADLLN